MADLNIRITGDAREAKAMFDTLKASATGTLGDVSKSVSEVQRRIAALVALPPVDFGGSKSAQESARVFEELAAGAKRVRDEIAGTAAALERNAELYRRGAIEATEFEAAQARAWRTHAASPDFIGPRGNPHAEEIAAAQAEVEARLAQASYGSLLGVGAPTKSASDSAAVFEESARAADLMQQKIAALRAEVDPVGTLQARLNAELAEFRTYAAAGAISAQELAAAEEMAAQRVQHLQAMVNRGTGVKGLTLWEKSNLAMQMNDVVTMLAMGSSPFQILATQGGQVYQILAGSDGGVTGAVKGLASSIYGMLGPVGLAAVGFTAMAAGAAYLLTSTRDTSKAIEDQERLLKSYKEAWDLVVKGVKPEPGKDGLQVVETQLAANKALLETRLASQGASLSRNLQGLRTTFIVSDESRFTDAIDRFAASVRNGRPEVSAFREELGRIAAAARQDLGLQKAANDLLEMTADAAKTEAAMKSFSRSIFDSATALKEMTGAMSGLRSAVPDYLSPERISARERGNQATRKILFDYDTFINKQQADPTAVVEAQRVRDLALQGARDDMAASIWKDILRGRAKAGVPDYAIENLSADLGQKVAQAFEAARGRGAGLPTVNEGFRTYQDQVALYRKDPNRAAKPGSSLHEKGERIDLGIAGLSEADQKIIREELALRGVINTNNETWHFGLRKSAVDEQNTKAADMFGKDESWRKIVVDFDKATAAARRQNDLLGQTPDVLARNRAMIELTAQAEKTYGKVSEEVSAQIGRLADKRAENVRIGEQEKRSYEGVRDAANFAGSNIADAFSGLVTHATTVDQAVKRIIDSLIQAGIQAALLGQGPLAGLFGTQSPVQGQMGGLFGWLFNFAGFKAKGGPVPAGKWAIAGENGPELIHGPAHVTPWGDLDTIAAPTPDYGADGGMVSNVFGSYSNTIHMHMPAPSGDPAQDRRHAEAMKREFKSVLDAHAAEFLRNQMRPGGMMRTEIEA